MNNHILNTEITTMAKLWLIVSLFAVFEFCDNLYAQSDSTIEMLQEIPNKYVNVIEKKIDKYTERVSKKTLKTLAKLSKWEEKIKASLQKISPETAKKLFGNSQLTFTAILEKLKKGEAIKLEYTQYYEKYRDDMTTGIKYLEKNKQLLDSGLSQRIRATKEKLKLLNTEEDSSHALHQFIKERKKQLIAEAFKYMGKSKYLTKMNKEVWYYGETIKNYKEIFRDEAKTEKLVNDVLKKVPGFQKFVRQNSMLAGVFGSQGDVANNAILDGLQTRTSVQQLIQQRISTGGTAGMEVFKENVKAAQAQLNGYKDKILKTAAGSGTGDGGLPDFKPNRQKTKTFLQRIEFGTNIQFARNNTLMPTTMDIAITAGYKLNDKSVAGIGGGYKMGLGTFDKIRFSTEGINFRTFIDWKLKKQFYLSGGCEMNYLNNAVQQGQLSPAWQQSALIGISKKFTIKTKWAKQTQLQLLYDLLAKRNLTQSWLLRVGYGF